MFKENNEKVNKSTFITYIVSSVLLFVYLIMILLIKFSNVFPKSVVSELFAIFVLVFFYISLLVSIIFGIVNFVKNKNKLVRKNIIIMYILIVLINVLVLVIPNAIYNNSSEKAKTKLNTKAEELLIGKHGIFVKALQIRGQESSQQMVNRKSLVKYILSVVKLNVAYVERVI